MSGSDTYQILLRKEGKAIEEARNDFSYIIMLYFGIRNEMCADFSKLFTAFKSG